MADITPTSTTTAQEDALRADRFDDTLMEADRQAALGKMLEAIQSSGWSTPTGTLSRAAFDASTVTATVAYETLAALITDLKAKGILTA